MVDIKLAHEWIIKADEVFYFAAKAFNDVSNTFYAQMCFHFQQAAEKYLKAYTVAYHLEFKKIHDLTELLRICEKHNAKFGNLLDEAEFLTDFYIDTRYPMHWPVQVSKEETKKAMASAEQIGNFAKTFMPSV